MKKHEMKMEHGRKRGGKMPEAFMKHDEAEKHEKKKRKAGGKVEGKKPMHRPDRRARGGATSDENPLTAAGKMSSMPYEAKQAPADDHGKGPDRD